MGQHNMSTLKLLNENEITSFTCVYNKLPMLLTVPEKKKHQLNIASCVTVLLHCQLLVCIVHDNQCQLVNVNINIIIMWLHLVSIQVMKLRQVLVFKVSNFVKASINVLLTKFMRYTCY